MLNSRHRLDQIILGLKQEKRWEADAMLDLALTYIGLGEFDKAIETANKSLELKVRGPHLAGLHLVKAEVALRQNNPSLALEDYDKTVKMILDDPFIKPRALAGAAQAAQLLEKNSKATEYRSQLRRSYPDWKEAPIPIGPPKD